MAVRPYCCCLRLARSLVAKSASSAHTRCSSSNVSTARCTPAADIGCGSCKKTSHRPLARQWHRKYQSDGGPGVLELAGILQGSVEAQRDLETLFKAQLVFFLLAATDGHAKNFSMRLLSGARFQLTPLYDVLSAWPVIGKRANDIPLEKVKLAMALPGQKPHYLLKSIQRRHFEVLARKMGLGNEAERLISEIAQRVNAAAEAAQRALPKGFPQALLERVLAGMRRQARMLSAID